MSQHRIMDEFTMSLREDKWPQVRECLFLHRRDRCSGTSANSDYIVRQAGRQIETEGLLVTQEVIQLS